MTPFEWQRVVEHMVRQDIVSEADAERCMEVARRTGGELARVMLDLGVISEEKLRDTLADYYGMGIWEKTDEPTSPCEGSEVLPVDFMRTNRIYPLAMDDGVVRLAVARPVAGWLREAIEKRTGCDVDALLATEKDVLEALNEAFGIGEKKDREGDGIERSVEVSADIEHLKDLASEAPVIRWVNAALTKALDLGASDIHIEPFENRVVVRYRVDGVLREVEPLPQQLFAPVVSRIKIISGLDIAERRLPQDGRNEIRVAGREADLRVSIIPTSHGEDVVIRILDRSQAMLDLDSLGMSEDVLTRFRRLIRRPYGLILLTGPTGSGKTTTLFSALKEIRSPHIKIITIEDPIEYHLEGVNQIQVKPDIGLTFASGLRSILRHDPDVILIGEIRDEETAAIAVQSALTGHLVLSTLHTNDAPSAFGRLINMGVKDYLVCSAVIGVMAQRLIRKICLNCKEPYVAAPEHLTLVGLDEGDTLYKGRGCKQCSWTGYKGRECVAELLIVDEELRKAIMKNRESDYIREVAQGQGRGFKSLWADAVEKVRTGHTTIEEVLREVGEAEDVFGIL